MMATFSDLNLAEPLDRALRELGHATPTPIQAQAIPSALQGRDIMGIAQTGTGKTAAFTLPTLNHVFTIEKDAPKRGARVLILAPTRELADQIAVAVRDYGRHIMDLSVACIFGGVPINRQIKRLVHGNDVIVATPGRLMDLLDRKAIRIDEVEVLILDEADQMMDMGFIHALKKIIPILPQKRQTLFFSATLAPAIKKLSQQFLNDPLNISVTPANTTAEKVEQHVYHVNQSDKQDLLSVALLNENVGRSLVFTRTKHGADRIVKRLAEVGILAVAIHGNKSQGQRQRALEDYRSGKVNILIATDIAARGIDIPDITHVFNYEIPNVPEQYVHRIGRTARAQRTGIAISFVDKSENNYLRDIEKLLRQELPKLDMPKDMGDRLKNLKLREPLPPPEKPKPDPRKGRGKSKKKARFSKSYKAKDKSPEGRKAATVSNKSRDERTNAPKDKPEQKIEKNWSKPNQPERTRSQKSHSNKTDRKPKAFNKSKNAKTESNLSETPRKSRVKSKPSSKPRSPEGRAGQSYSGKAFKGKGIQKIKPSRAKRKANRQASGKTKSR